MTCRGGIDGSWVAARQQQQVQQEHRERLKHSAACCRHGIEPTTAALQPVCRPEGHTHTCSARCASSITNFLSLLLHLSRICARRAGGAAVGEDEGGAFSQTVLSQLH